MNNPYYRFAYTILSLSLFMLQSCQKEDYMAEIDTQNQITQTGENFHTGQLLKNPYEIHTFRRAYQKVLDSMEYGSYDTGKGYNNLKKRKGY